MNSALRQWVLSAIGKHDGRWYWWQMDRALSSEGKTDWLPLLVPTLNDLEREELIEYVSHPEHPTIRYCRLTDAGRVALGA